MRNFTIILSLFILGTFNNFAQENKEALKKKEKQLRESDNLVADANKELDENKFIEAEVTYRKAIAKSGENAHAKYNLGNAYYENESYGEAFTRYKQAGEVAETKAQKHKAYHNMGNVFMNEKAYEKAVEAYKEALRNNPSDDETRYNLALAKEMLKKQQQQDKNQDKNKDKKEDQKENKDQKDKDQKDKDEKNEDQKENKGQDKDDKKEGDKENQKPEENKDKQGEKKEDQKQEEKEGKPEDEKGQPKPRPGQLSPQQIKNILEAMSNEEKKVQEKLNAKKTKGSPRRSEKDW